MRRKIKFIQKRFYLCNVDKEGIVQEAFLIMPRINIKFSLVHGMGRDKNE